MPSPLRVVLLWLVMLALPLQGLAAVVRVHCASHAGVAQGVVAAVHMEHAHASHGHPHDATAAGHGHADVDDTAGQAGSCSACAACCAALGLPAAWPQVVAPPPADLIAATLLPQPASFVPPGLERPPRPIRA